MALPPLLQRLKLPVIGAPMFIAGNPKLVVEQCKAGIVGSFPALNARPKEALDAWLTEIEQALAGVPDAAPYAVNQIVHKSNDRLMHDLDMCVKLTRSGVEMMKSGAPTAGSCRLSKSAGSDMGVTSESSIQLFWMPHIRPRISLPADEC